MGVSLTQSLSGLSCPVLKWGWCLGYLPNLDVPGSHDWRFHDMCEPARPSPLEVKSPLLFLRTGNLSCCSSPPLFLSPHPL